MTTNTPRAASDERPTNDALPLAGRRIADRKSVV